MAKSKFGIQFEGFSELMEELDKLGGELEEVAEECLIAAHEEVTPLIKADIARHHNTGRTEASIVDRPVVTWEGQTASVDIGFNLKQGGMPSLFLMYGTPRMKKDAKLYNDIYGSGIRKKIAEKQEAILQRKIQERLGG